MLVRLDPKRNRIAVLSLPRDLAVTIPGYADNTKINQAYDEGGARADAEDGQAPVLERDRRASSTINSVIDVNFNGFQRAVNYVDGVYVDVDRHYYNPEGTGFAAIDIQPGYQRLVGSDALAYVRYRHTDSRPLPQRPPAGVPAPGGATSPRSTSSRASARPRTSWARCAATSASTRSSCRAATWRA